MILEEKNQEKKIKDITGVTEVMWQSHTSTAWTCTLIPQEGGNTGAIQMLAPV